jgi:hypothetical protein
LIRAALWSTGASLYLGVLTLLMTSHDDLAVNAASHRFMIEQLAAVATSVSAAAAAFVSVVPGYSRRVLFLPAAAATAACVSEPHPSRIALLAWHGARFSPSCTWLVGSVEPC